MSTKSVKQAATSRCGGCGCSSLCFAAVLLTLPTAAEDEQHLNSARDAWDADPGGILRVSFGDWNVSEAPEASSASTVVPCYDLYKDSQLTAHLKGLEPCV